jgi:hypothetical protein
VRVLDAVELKKFLPVRPLFLQRRRAEARFNPFHAPISQLARLRHVALVFVARDGAIAKRTVLDRVSQRVTLTRLDSRSNQISHRGFGIRDSRFDIVGISWDLDLGIWDLGFS